MKNIISTHQVVFLVKFLNSRESFIIGSDNEVLGDLIQKNGNNGIEYIKQFEPSKSKFSKMSKEAVKSWFKYDTHSIEKLKLVNYIK